MAISTWITDVSIDNPSRTELDRLAAANEPAHVPPHPRGRPLRRAAGPR